MTDALALHAELIHAAKLVVEAALAACLLTFAWFMAPYFRAGGPRR